MLIASCLFILVGAFMALRPLLYWMIIEKWKTDAEKPKDSYRVFVRVLGAGFVLAGIILLIIFLTVGEI